MSERARLMHFKYSDLSMIKKCALVKALGNSMIVGMVGRVLGQAGIILAKYELNFLRVAIALRAKKFEDDVVKAILAYAFPYVPVYKFVPKKAGTVVLKHWMLKYISL